jgi:hypothetical protein
MQGQDTLVVVGGVKKTDASEDEGTPLRTGAGSMIEVEQGGDAKYIGVNSQGLSEQRQALENDRKRAETRSGQLINSGGSNTESGSALQTRIGAQTATLNQIAMTGASALESLLKMCAQWMGANPDDVKVTPNLEFADFEMSGKDLVDFMTARTMGAPLSKKSIHAMLVDRGVTKMDFDAGWKRSGKRTPMHRRATVRAQGATQRWSLVCRGSRASKVGSSNSSPSKAARERNPWPRQPTRSSWTHWCVIRSTSCAIAGMSATA